MVRVRIYRILSIHYLFIFDSTNRNTGHDTPIPLDWRIRDSSRNACMWSLAVACRWDRSSSESRAGCERKRRRHTRCTGSTAGIRGSRVSTDDGTRCVRASVGCTRPSHPEKTGCAPPSPTAPTIACRDAVRRPRIGDSLGDDAEQSSSSSIECP